MRKQNRLKEYDYSTPNAYFITICTNKRKKLFWENAESGNACPYNVKLTKLGMITRQSIAEIPKRYPVISVDHFVIMPNHIHLLLQINTDVNGRSLSAPTISTVVRLMKSTVSKEAGFPVWQKGFYDHVIRNNDDYENIWNYMEGNPSRWVEDQLNSDLPENGERQRLEGKLLWGNE